MEPQEKKHRGSFGRDLVITLVLAVVVANVIQGFIVRPFYIPSASMSPSLEIGDTVLVNRTAYMFGEVERGDVVVFEDPENWVSPDTVEDYSTWETGMSYVGLYPRADKFYLVKRVVALPGDSLYSRGDGHLYLNGDLLEESYLPDGEESSLTEFTVKVPEGGVWVMGDNRDRSADSRFHRDTELDGAVPLGKVLGEVVHRF